MSMPIGEKMRANFIRPNQLIQNSGGVITQGQLRRWLFHRKDNGLNRAIVQHGRRLWLNEQKFWEWFSGEEDADGQ
jgi:hypothetical protein